MEKLIGACGLSCSECEGYKATQANDDTALKEIAAKSSEQFGEDIGPNSLRCDGCMTGSDRRCGYCAVCAIRMCALSKGLSNCAVCNAFGCEKISRFLSSVPRAKENLEHIRAQLNA